VAYPVDQNLMKMKKERFPAILLDSIRLGQSLDTLKEKNLKKEKENILQEVLAFAKRCRYDESHARQVRKLSLSLFDQLKTLRQLGERERFLLECGALLHDVGWMDGGERHHKRSRDLILNAPELSFDDEDRKIVALIARYHRKSLPQADHKIYYSLSAENKQVVHSLASILRLADGLDATHQALIKDVECFVWEENIRIELISEGVISAEIEACQEKADFFKEFFGKKILLKIR